MMSARLILMPELADTPALWRHDNSYLQLGHTIGMLHQTMDIPSHSRQDPARAAQIFTRADIESSIDDAV
jgi:hypothetical protein